MLDDMRLNVSGSHSKALYILCRILCHHPAGEVLSTRGFMAIEENCRSSSISRQINVIKKTKCNKGMKKEREKEDNTCSVAPLHSTIG